MYRLEYVEGQRAPRAVISATPDQRHGAADGCSSRATARAIRTRRLDPVRVGLRRRRHGRLDRPEPDPHLHAQRRLHRQADRHRLRGKTDTQDHAIIVGNTAPTITINTPVDGDFFEWGERIPYTVTVTDPEDGAIDCSRVEVTFVLVHDTHGHGEDEQTGCSGTLQTLAEDASHGGYIAGGISVTYTDKGGDGQAALTTTQQNVVQQRRQQPEFVQRGRPRAAVRGDRRGGRRARSGRRPGGEQPSIRATGSRLNNRYNLGNMDKQITHPLRGRRGQQHGRQPARWASTIRADSPTGPIVGGGTLRVDRRQQQHLHEPDVPAGLHGFAQALPGVPLGPGTAASGAGHDPAHDQHGPDQLGRVQRPGLGPTVD